MEPTERDRARTALKALVSSTYKSDPQPHYLPVFTLGALDKDTEPTCPHCGSTEVGTVPALGIAEGAMQCQDCKWDNENGAPIQVDETTKRLVRAVWHWWRKATDENAMEVASACESWYKAHPGVNPHE